MALRHLSGLDEQESRKLGNFLGAMNCRIRLAKAGLLDLLLDQPVIEAIESHLSWCGECQEAIAEERKGSEECGNSNGTTEEELQRLEDRVFALVATDGTRLHHLAGSKTQANELEQAKRVEMFIEILLLNKRLIRIREVMRSFNNWKLFLRHLQALMRYQS